MPPNEVSGEQVRGSTHFKLRRERNGHQRRTLHSRGLGTLQAGTFGIHPVTRRWWPFWFHNFNYRALVSIIS